jgi:hypothetical protein
MLNALGGVPEEVALHVLGIPMPAIAPGEGFPGQVFHSTSLLAKSKFSDIYLVRGTFGEQVLQVRTILLPASCVIMVVSSGI